MIRFLHAADLHLGLRITRFDEDACGRVGEARFSALERLRHEAAKRNVDFILVAGDLFDDHSVSRSDATRAFAILESSAGACPVYIIPGNHDPLIPGGVWDRDPWLREQPHLRVHLLRTNAPVSVPNLPVNIYPCPLKQRRSMDDPTGWISNHPRTESDSHFRIGLAHGSLKIGIRLPDDDHLIRFDAADQYGLDYLALGHWHKRLLHPSADGVVRTAYSGTNEPMGFPDGDGRLETGWSSYSTDGDAERFHDDGRGSVLLVTIERPGAPPNIESVDTGILGWRSERLDVTGRSFGSLMAEFSGRLTKELTILRLTLSGVMEPRRFARLDELRQIIQNRYHAGSSMDSEGVLIEPNAEELAEAVGHGVLKRVLDRLHEDSHSIEPEKKQIADHALNLLYQIAWEARPA